MKDQCDLSLEDLINIRNILKSAAIYPSYMFTSDGNAYKKKRIPVYPYEIWEEIEEDKY